MTNYSIEVLEEPSLEPVDAEELAAFLDLNVDVEDVEDLLDEFLTAAREMFEALTDGRIVVPTTFVQHLPGFPCGRIELMRGKVLSVSSVTYTDPNGDDQELEDWTADTTGIPALVCPPSSGWPNTSTTKPRPVSVEFVAGWEVPPKSVRFAIKSLAGHYYQQREAFGTVDYKEVPGHFKQFCDNYKTGLGGL